MGPRDRVAATIAMLQRQADPLARREGDEWLSAGAIADGLGAEVDRTTIFRDLQGLVDSGVLVAEGGTRSRRYRLAPDSKEFLKWELSQPKEARRRVPYNPEVIDRYQPNVTSWLGKKRLKHLHALAAPKFRADEAAYRRLMNSLLIDLSYASSKLEDVNISWLDTKSLVELGERPQGLSDTEYRIVMNHKQAIQFICENRNELDLSRRNIFDVHRLLTDGLLGNPADAGRIRKGMVYFAESAYAPLSNEFQLNDQLELFSAKANAVRDPLERSLFTMAAISYLQPFQDGNKRTSRLCMNIPLLASSLAPFSFTQVNRRDYVFGLLAFYERGRSDFLADVFIDTYERSAPKYLELLQVVHDGGTISSVEVGPPDVQRPAAAPSPAPRRRRPAGR